MPRNPYKRPCQVPGCANWAMRAAFRCRAHRDAELGPRGVGAPTANHNALATGQYAHPLNPGQLNYLARRLALQPDLLPLLFYQLIDSLHGRSSDPTIALHQLERLLPPLRDRVASHLFALEFTAFLQACPPERRDVLRDRIWHEARHLPPTVRLRRLRQAIKNSTENQ